MIIQYLILKKSHKSYKNLPKKLGKSSKSQNVKWCFPRASALYDFQTNSTKNILEIGTYTGYSAICIAEGLQEHASIDTIDKNEELADLQNKYFEKSGFRNKIIQHVGLALEIIPTIHKKFDLVFIDADKFNYSNYFHLIIDKMNKGGVILSDNVLWSGKVVEKLDPKDQDTKALLEYNKLLNTDKRIETVLLPIRDGLTISRVK